MERFWFWLAGFAVPMVLVVGFLIVKNVVEDRMEKIAQDVCEKYFRGVIQYTRDLTVNTIDRRLAEKEGEHEDTEL